MYNDEIRTNRNWHELIRRSAMQYDAIRVGSIRRVNTNVWTFQNIRIGLRTNTKVAANQYEVIRINTVLCDAQRMPIRIGSQTTFATVGRGHKLPTSCSIWSRKHACYFMIDTYKSQNVIWYNNINSIIQGAQCGNNYMYVTFPRYLDDNGNPFPWHKACVLAAEQFSWMFIFKHSFRLSIPPPTPPPPPHPPYLSYYTLGI